MDRQIRDRRPNLVLINKKKKRTFQFVNFAVLTDHIVEVKEGEIQINYLNLARELKKLKKFEKHVDDIHSCNVCNNKMWKKGLGELVIRGIIETKKKWKRDWVNWWSEE